MRRVFLISSLLLLLTSTICASQTEELPGNIHGQEYKITTAVDSLELYAWMTFSPTAPAPLYVLLPMMGNTHNSYDKFITELYKKAEENEADSIIPHFLTFDLRGHGKSVTAKNGMFNYKEMTPEDFTKYPEDIAEMIRRVLADKSLRIDRKNVTVIGASIGANSSIMVTPLMDNITRVVMLSPGENYRSLEPGDAVKKFMGDIMIMAGREDSYSSESCEKLAELNPDHVTLKIYDGVDHGTTLINNNEEAMNDLMEWLMKQTKED